MLNEFRQDLVSGEWVLFATGRAKRPNAEDATERSRSVTERERLRNADDRNTEHSSANVEDAESSRTRCPFDDPTAAGQEIVSTTTDGWVTVIKNKFPAVTPGLCTPPQTFGPFAVAAANGFHEVVITHDHNRSFQDFTSEETLRVLKVFRERYLEIAKYECGDYIQIFNNTGLAVGASIAHPHSQILSTPILPPMVTRSVNGAARYYREHKQRVHAVLLSWEQEQKKRIVFENDLFIALCPYVSKRPYEIKLFPKQPSARFETADDAGLAACAEALNACLQKLGKLMPDLQYNFFIHTAPVRENLEIPSTEFYHWHIEIIPHHSILAGFDFSTGIIVNVIDPDQAAAELRNL